MRARVYKLGPSGPTQGEAEPLPIRATQPDRVSAVAPGPAPDPVPGDAAAPDVDLRGLKVLIVDDERDARELIAAFLQPTGAVVLTAENGDQALSLVVTQRPDVIVVRRAQYYHAVLAHVILDAQETPRTCRSTWPSCCVRPSR